MHLTVNACGDCQVTAAMAPHWAELRAGYVEPLLRGLERAAAEAPPGSGPPAELALVCYGAATPFSACPLDRGGWTSDAALFRQWLDAVMPAGGGRQQTVLTGAARGARRRAAGHVRCAHVQTHDSGTCPAACACG